MKLTQIDNKTYIDLRQLLGLGFGYPKKGSPVVIKLGIFSDFEYNYKFFEKKEGRGSVVVSPFATEIGKRHPSECEVYIELSPNNFIYNGAE